MVETDFIDVNVPQLRDKVLSEIRKVEQEFTAKHLPYDRTNALADFDEYCEDYAAELIKAKQRKLTLPIFKSDWEWTKYGKQGRFKLLATKDIHYTNLKTGHSNAYIGVDEDYIHEASGVRVTVFVPIDEWNQRKGTKKE